jgi:hypothetical protein
MSTITRYSPADTIDLLESGMFANDLESTLQNLCRVGKPRISKQSDGWVCAVDMHVAAAGTEFKIRSEFDCPTPFKAARQCTQRVVETLKQWA